MAKKEIIQNKIQTERSGWDILKRTWRIITIGISALMLLIFAMIFISIFSSFMPQTFDGNVAIIPINGVISTGDEMFTKTVKSYSVNKLIEQANNNEKIKAIIFEIDSPGGTPVATDEIATTIKNTNKTTIAVIRETGASGAYWIATATDKIYANRMSITGSIGVKSGGLDFSGLMTDYNVTYRRLVAGELKDAGTPFRPMTEQEKTLFQKLLDKLHVEFIKAVAENRKLPEEKVKELATGFVYLGTEAKELGLIDEFGGRKEALKYLEQKLEIKARPVEYKETTTFFDKLSEVTSNNPYDFMQTTKPLLTI